MRLGDIVRIKNMPDKCNINGVIGQIIDIGEFSEEKDLVTGKYFTGKSYNVMFANAFLCAEGLNVCGFMEDEIELVSVEYKYVQIPVFVASVTTDDGHEWIELFADQDSIEIYANRMKEIGYEISQQRLTPMSRKETEDILANFFGD